MGYCTVISLNFSIFDTSVVLVSCGVVHSRSIVGKPSTFFLSSQSSIKRLVVFDLDSRTSYLSPLPRRPRRFRVLDLRGPGRRLPSWSTPSFDH